MASSLTSSEEWYYERYKTRASVSANLDGNMLAVDKDINVHLRVEYKCNRFIEYLRVVEEGDRGAKLFQLQLADDNRLVYDDPGDTLRRAMTTRLSK